jgi:hypothetical protein
MLSVGQGKKYGYNQKREETTEHATSEESETQNDICRAKNDVINPRLINGAQALQREKAQQTTEKLDKDAEYDVKN